MTELYLFLSNLTFPFDFLLEWIVFSFDNSRFLIESRWGLSLLWCGSLFLSWLSLLIMYKKPLVFLHNLIILLLHFSRNRFLRVLNQTHILFNHWIVVGMRRIWNSYFLVNRQALSRFLFCFFKLTFSEDFRCTYNFWHLLFCLGYFHVLSWGFNGLLLNYYYLRLYFLVWIVATTFTYSLLSWVVCFAPGSWLIHYLSQSFYFLFKLFKFLKTLKNYRHIIWAWNATLNWRLFWGFTFSGVWIFNLQKA